MSANGMVRPCSGPANKRSWQGGAKDEEHAMSDKLNCAIAVIGIDIGKNSFHIVGQDQRALSCCDRSGRVVRLNPDLPTSCRA